MGSKYEDQGNEHQAHVSLLGRYESQYISE
jgi:hypothetical protein